MFGRRIHVDRKGEDLATMISSYGPALMTFVGRIVTIQEDDGVYALDIDKTTANGGQGYGWNCIWLDDITVYEDGNLTYGVTTRQNTEYDGSWFSACDFIVERAND